MIWSDPVLCEAELQWYELLQRPAILSLEGSLSDCVHTGVCSCQGAKEPLLPQHPETSLNGVSQWKSQCLKASPQNNCLQTLLGIHAVFSRIGGRDRSSFSLWQMGHHYYSFSLFCLEFMLTKRNFFKKKKKRKKRFLGNKEVFVVFHKMPERHKLAFTSVVEGNNAWGNSMMQSGNGCKAPQTEGGGSHISSASEKLKIRF